MSPLFTLAGLLLLHQDATSFSPLSPSNFVRRALQQQGSSTLNAVSVDAGTTYEKTTFRLYYVPTVDDIDDSKPGTPAKDFEDIDAHKLTNDKGVTVKAIARGANLIELAVEGINYVWENVDGACYYGGKNESLGIDPNAFPLKRGLILNGGIRFAAVTAEHGLYYDSEWNVDIDDEKNDEKSIIFSIVDSIENRNKAANLTPKQHPWVSKGLSQGQFNRQDQNTPTDILTKYPVTDMEYTYKISLRQGEDFVRLRMSVKNASPTVKEAEAWLPMTFPITERSTILSHQDLRWRRDTWCFEDVPNMVTWKNHPPFDIPLNWPTSGIFYDFPRKKGLFHGVTTNPDMGQGVVYCVLTKVDLITPRCGLGETRITLTERSPSKR